MTERRVQFQSPQNPLIPYVFGIEDLFNVPQSFKHQTTTYPPHNIIQDGDNYRIEIAVAGFSQDELTVSKEKRQLIVKGRISREENKPVVYRHKGISTKSFDLSFTLAEHVVIDGVVFKDGILTVSMHKVIPEEDKPVDFVINAK